MGCAEQAFTVRRGGIGSFRTTFMPFSRQFALGKGYVVVCAMLHNSLCGNSYQGTKCVNALYIGAIYVLWNIEQDI